MSYIKSIQAIQVFDSRGTPTISCRIDLESGTSYTSMVPSGASTGSREALELRDGGNAYLGKGVQMAINNIQDTIAPALVGMDVTHQQLIDQKMLSLDGSETKSNLGANAILGVSLAVLGAAANETGMPLYQYVNKIYSDINGVKLKMNLPIPMLNIINGGEHADNNIDIQEFMIMPIGASSFSQGMQWSSEIYAGLKKLLQDQNLSTGVGDEGGFAPNLKSNNEAIELIMHAITNNGLRPGADVSIALDCAATEFYEDNLYHLKGEFTELTSAEFSKYLESLVSNTQLYLLRMAWMRAIF